MNGVELIAAERKLTLLDAINEIEATKECLKVIAKTDFLRGAVAAHEVILDRLRAIQRQEGQR